MLSLIADVHKSVGSHKEGRSSRKEGYNIIVIKESQHVRFWHMLGHKLENKLDFSSKKQEINLTYHRFSPEKVKLWIGKRRNEARVGGGL